VRVVKDTVNVRKNQAKRELLEEKSKAERQTDGDVHANSNHVNEASKSLEQSESNVDYWMLDPEFVRILYGSFFV